MDKLDRQVLQTASKWLHDGFAILLVTVTKTWGSSPRPPGALAVLRSDGHVVGSVSGGCIEDDLIYRLQQEGMPSAVSVQRYGVTAEQVRRFGLPCGGAMELVLEPLHESTALDELLAFIESGQLVARELSLITGKSSITPARADQDMYYDKSILRCVFGPHYRLLIIGAGELSAALAQIALSLDFAVTVCDPREEYAEEWMVTNVSLSRSMPDDLVVAMKPDPRMAVIALTHDPKLDDLALMEALKSPAFYVAALGSRRNNEIRRERLLEFDLSRAQLMQLRGPAGLFIGSKKPAEIAVSIAAELVAVKNGVTIERAMDIELGKELARQVEDEMTHCRVGHG